MVGDAMVDRYWFGDVSRISPEAPIPVVRVERQEERLGAAANVAENCRSMGAKVDTVFSPSRENVVKVRLIARHQQVARIDFDEPQEPVSEEMFKSLVPQADVVVFSDYGKGALSDIARLIPIAKKEKKTVLVDPKGHDYERYRGADLVKPNLDEMKELVGGWTDEIALAMKATRVMRDFGIGHILLSRARDGMTLYEHEFSGSLPSAYVHIRSEAKEVFDVTGAGDTAIAAFAVATAKGNSVLNAARLANKAAGIKVSKFGTATVSADEVFG